MSVFMGFLTRTLHVPVCKPSSACKEVTTVHLSNVITEVHFNYMCLSERPPALEAGVETSTGYYTTG